MNERIAIDPRIHFGKPTITGTRITVENVLELVCDGVTFTEIIENCYPELTPEDIQACIQYAMDVVA
ncbi:MAG: DUF433 domain-containing protein [Chloroflexi bacterium]|nr:DUF433 domain-containing protein [Ardenticatenaceae bacterium]MBL1131240.1 DUF433 domain-containing protein [Chloroflexota bacterium]NOG37340.1 DUF433 domain-containing protein [Chloroflexota bacterium]